MIKRIFIKYNLIICVVGLILPFTSQKVMADSGNPGINIATSPDKVFFNLNNLKPGDSFTKTLTVYNHGKQDFKYLFSNRFLNGSEKFYNELILTITDNKKKLFNGKLKDFEDLNPRALKKGASEELVFSLKIPYDLGNEYQGLRSEFQFKFFVEGTLGGILPVNGPKLPETGTNTFNILVAGVVLVFTGIITQLIIKRRKKLERPIWYDLDL